MKMHYRDTNLSIPVGLKKYSNRKWLKIARSKNVEALGFHFSARKWSWRNEFSLLRAISSWSVGISLKATCCGKPITPVEFKTIPQPWILDAWHHTDLNFITRDFLTIFGRLFGRVPVRILTSDFHHCTQRKKDYKTRDYGLGVLFSSWDGLVGRRIETLWFLEQGPVEEKVKENEPVLGTSTVLSSDFKLFTLLTPFVLSLSLPLSLSLSLSLSLFFLVLSLTVFTSQTSPQHNHSTFGSCAVWLQSVHSGFVVPNNFSTLFVCIGQSKEKLCSKNIKLVLSGFLALSWFFFILLFRCTNGVQAPYLFSVPLKQTHEAVCCANVLRQQCPPSVEWYFVMWNCKEAANGASQVLTCWECKHNRQAPLRLPATW